MTQDGAKCLENCSRQTKGKKTEVGPRGLPRGIKKAAAAVRGTGRFKVRRGQSPDGKLPKRENLEQTREGSSEKKKWKILESP